MPKKTKPRKVMRPVIEEIIENKPIIEEEVKALEVDVTTPEIPQASEPEKPKDSGFRLSMGFVFLTIVVAVIVAILAGGFMFILTG